MPFSAQERNALLSVRGVGPMVIARFEQMGLSSLAQLADADLVEVLVAGSALAGSSCWKNSLQARAAVEAAIALARSWR